MGSGEHHLTSREKVLYHQIHPAKLATDIGVTPLSLYLLWMHQLVLGILSGFVPALIASAVVIRYANLDRYAASPLGRYVGKYMTRRMQAVRLSGMVVALVGAWQFNPSIIGFGIFIVVLGWARGKIFP